MTIRYLSCQCPYISARCTLEFVEREERHGLPFLRCYERHFGHNMLVVVSLDAGSECFQFGSIFQQTVCDPELHGGVVMGNPVWVADIFEEFV